MTGYDGYHGQFEPHLPLIRRLHAEGNSPSAIAALVPTVGAGAWETRCSAQMVIYILRREKLSADRNHYQPPSSHNARYINDFRRRWDKWQSRPVETLFQYTAGRLFLELASIIKALEIRRKTDGVND
jgi:hypothetical protein